jgi:hypothetical protein
MTMSVGYPPEKGGGRDATDNERQAEDRSDLFHFFFNHGKIRQFSENLYLIPFNDGKGYYLRYHLEGW